MISSFAIDCLQSPPLLLVMQYIIFDIGQISQNNNKIEVLNQFLTISECGRTFVKEYHFWHHHDAFRWYYETDPIDYY